MAFEEAAELMKQAGDATRLRIFWKLGKKEERVQDLAGELGMSAPAVSHHLKQLRMAGLVSARRDGKGVYYHTSGDRRAAFLTRMLSELLGIAEES